jgi:hypothetical protein
VNGRVTAGVTPTLSWYHLPGENKPFTRILRLNSS